MGNIRLGARVGGVGRGGGDGGYQRVAPGSSGRGCSVS